MRGILSDACSRSFCAVLLRFDSRTSADLFHPTQHFLLNLFVRARTIARLARSARCSWRSPWCTLR